MKKVIDLILATENQNLDFFFTAKGKIYTFLNPVSYLKARRNKSIFLKFNGIFVDGSILCKVIQCFYKKKVSRTSFDMTSLAPKLINYCLNENQSIYLVGAQEDELIKAINNFKFQYENLKIEGYHNGFFATQIQKEECYKHIIMCKPDFLIIGMGIIKQEYFLIEIQERGFKGIGFTCGGFISQISKNIKIDYYPMWINKYNLRFMYRAYKEKHTRIRYIKTIFLFPILFIKDFISKSKE